jgi:peptidoglycan/xylan/chitin deacetylase (PgdA/CDA1 family)
MPNLASCRRGTLEPDAFRSSGPDTCRSGGADVSAPAAAMRSSRARKGLFPDTEVAQRIKSALLLPIGTVVGAFGSAETVALTFDDGPDLDVTPRVLDVLARHGAKATFFVLVDHARARPALLRRILDEGHEVGLHFDRHDRITDLPKATAFRRMRKAKRDLSELAGPISLFRPPYGSQNHFTYLIARLLKLEVVGWSRQGDDWIEQTAEHSAGLVTKDLRGGDIILLHDGLELGPDEPHPTLDRAQVTDLVLCEAARRRLKTVTVGELLATRAPQRTRWFR